MTRKSTTVLMVQPGKKGMLRYLYRYSTMEEISLDHWILIEFVFPYTCRGQYAFANRLLWSGWSLLDFPCSLVEDSQRTLIHTNSVGSSRITMIPFPVKIPGLCLRIVKKNDILCVCTFNVYSFETNIEVIILSCKACSSWSSLSENINYPTLDHDHFHWRLKVSIWQG